MSAAGKAVELPGSSLPTEALYFGGGEARLFGWLHRAPTEFSTDLGLVICKPFGYEADCAHQSIRAISEMAAAAGVPTLRFDYSGTGDSADIDPHAEQLDTWSQDVIVAIRELRRLTGVSRVCLLGIRLGAVVAAMASQNESVAGLVLISPTTKGRRYLRDLRITRLAASMSSGLSDTSSPPQPQGASDEDGSLEVSGYTLSAATLAALAAVDLTARRTFPPMLIIDGSSMPVARDWAAALSSESNRVDYAALPGLIEMVMALPHDAKPSAPILQATCAWLQRISAEKATGDAKHPAHPAGASTSAASLQLPGTEPQLPITERPVYLARNPDVFGILTIPHAGNSHSRAVIMMNAGATYHAGPNRSYVSLARRWARCGCVVLRMDLAGLGDSDAHSGQQENDVFPATALDDIRAAIEFLRTRIGIDDITLYGFCSGGYHSIRAAAAGMRVNRIIIINPENFFWKAGTDIHSLQSLEIVKRTRDHRDRIVSLAAWKKLLAGQIDLLRILKIYAQRPMLAVESQVRDWARYLRIRLPHDLGWDLEEIVGRGVRVIFVFARGEAGVDLLRIQAGSSMQRLGARCRIHIVDRADHIFSSAGPRAVLEQILSDELFDRVPEIEESITSGKGTSAVQAES